VSNLRYPPLSTQASHAPERGRTIPDSSVHTWRIRSQLALCRCSCGTPGNTTQTRKIEKAERRRGGERAEPWREARSFRAVFPISHTLPRIRLPCFVSWLSAELPAGLRYACRRLHETPWVGYSLLLPSCGTGFPHLRLGRSKFGAA